MSPLPGAGVVAERVQTIRSRLSQLGGPGVALVAVTKGHPVDSWSLAAGAGCDAVGENYAQELVDKARSFPAGQPIPVHFIGTVQSNKVRMLSPIVDLWQGVDRASALTEIGRRQGRGPHGTSAPVLLQVNSSGESSKSGCDPDDLDRLLAEAGAVGVTVAGLMTIGPTSGDRAERLRCFRLLRRLVDQNGLEVCSMGMSDDYEDAVECGSTMVRVGTALFGPRS